MMEDEDPGKYTKMPDPKTLKFRDFYPNHFGQFLSEFGTMPSPNPIFIRISDQAFKFRFFFQFFGLSRTAGHLYVY
jgi:hypothetical protein